MTCHLYITSRKRADKGCEGGQRREGVRGWLRREIRHHGTLYTILPRNAYPRPYILQRTRGVRAGVAESLRCRMPSSNFEHRIDILRAGALSAFPTDIDHVFLAIEAKTIQPTVRPSCTTVGRWSGGASTGSAINT